MSGSPFEMGRGTYAADFVFYALAVAALATASVWAGPPGEAARQAGWAVAGLALWSLAEYGLHRFVLHRLQPFRRWHAEHHRRPGARIGTPTAVSAVLFAALVFVPARWLLGAWPAAALLLGMLAGYLAYAVVHHRVHHAGGNGPWLGHRRRVHARHHRAGGTTVCYGVTSSLWDRVFGTLQP